MSEAMCGPSNPLQQFKQQTQLDRTLQQDRLATRHSPAQGFRSADPSSRFVDAEFEAFQAGPQIPDLQPFRPQHALASPAPFGAQQLPSWAADFQRLQVSAPVPIQQHQPQFVPQQSSSPSWATDFRQHIAQPAPRAQSSSPSPWAFQQRARYGMSASTFAPSSLSEQPLSKGKAAVRDDFDEAAFARAFDMVAQEVEPMEDETLGQETTQHADIFENPEAMEDVIEKAMKESLFDPETVLGNVSFEDEYGVSEMDYNGGGVSDVDYNGASLSADAPPLHEEEVQPGTETQDLRADDDALAWTAGELLDRVKDNQSDKFQNSTFLELMRKLKDREVKVEGDKMVETTSITGTAESALKAPSASFPSNQQDHDPFRSGPPASDGQDVVGLLASQMGGDDTDIDFMMSSPYHAHNADDFGFGI
ncbi:hypothetical protein AMS68_007373 [Peltaster fructicola]|uniref:Peroxin 20 n=1 Tax=Peltaster fructicola TaxID=286661 RepID=A0A6H0Y4G7_9PEZI|nr:hypothetical protein AMS68_007373 [Peltaster fructicola]